MTPEARRYARRTFVRRTRVLIIYRYHGDQIDVEVVRIVGPFDIDHLAFCGVSDLGIPTAAPPFVLIVGCKPRGNFGLSVP